MEDSPASTSPSRMDLQPNAPAAAALAEEVAKVLVANVYAGGATVELDLPASTTIGTLKSRLRDSFAERPNPSEQRLIYCGKICEEDDKPLRDVLRDLRSPQTFHLVLCKSPTTRRPRARPETTTTTTTPPSPSPSLGGDHHPRPRDQPETPRAPPVSSSSFPQTTTTTTTTRGEAEQQHQRRDDPSFSSRGEEEEQSTSDVLEEAYRLGGWNDSLGQGFLSLEEAWQNGQLPAVNTTTFVLGTTPATVAAGVLQRPPPLSSRVASLLRRWAAHPVVVALDLKLLAKLVAVVALLGHDGNFYRLVGLCVVASVAFLVQTGIARIALAAVVPARAGGLVFDADDSNEHTPRAALVRAIVNGHLPDPDTLPRSLRFDLPLFLLSFVLSLAPAWRPRRQPRQHRD